MSEQKLSDAWQCQSCGCYFPHIPKILDNDVKRCSKCVEVEILEAGLSKMEEAEIRVGPDDEYVHSGVFHMERMHEGHIWFRIGNEAFDLYAPEGGRLTWVPQISGGWDALAGESDEQTS